MRRSLMMKHKGSRLPSGYTEVEYIENNSNAYIDTNFIPKGDGYKFDLHFNPSALTGATSISGTFNLPQGAGITFINNNGLKIYYGNSNATQFKAIDNLIIGNKYHLVVDANNDNINILFNDIPYNFTNPTNIQNIDKSLTLFVENEYNDSLVGNFKGKIYNYIISQNDQLVRDFIPCINPQNEVGLYDMVEQKFYKSPNGTPFIAGKPIEPPKPAKEYVKDGLVFWLDGRQQGGQPNKWIDLIQNIPFDLVDCVSNEDNVQFDGVKSYGYNKDNVNSLIFSQQTHTIELVIDDENYLSSTFQCIFLPPKISNQLLFGIAGNRYTFTYNWGTFAYNVVKKKQSVISFKIENNSTYLLYNKEIQQNKTNGNINIPLGDIATLGTRCSNSSIFSNGDFFKGKIHAIRIYNRHLTEEEILHNQQLDVDNYFGGVIE